MHAAQSEMLGRTARTIFLDEAYALMPSVDLQQPPSSAHQFFTLRALLQIFHLQICSRVIWCDNTQPASSVIVHVYAPTTAQFPSVQSTVDACLSDSPKRHGIVIRGWPLIWAPYKFVIIMVSSFFCHFFLALFPMEFMSDLIVDTNYLRTRMKKKKVESFARVLKDWCIEMYSFEVLAIAYARRQSWF